MANLTALLDASVLYGAPLRDLLLRLATAGLFQARWTRHIHEEWISALLENRPDLVRQRLERTRDLMDAAVLDCLVQNYEPLIRKLSLPDPNDRHVLAAAIKCGADMIVTANLADFPARILERHDLVARSPDEFIHDMILLVPDEVCTVARTHRTSLRQPARSVAEYLNALERQSLSRTVDALRKLADQL